MIKSGSHTTIIRKYVSDIVARLSSEAATSPKLERGIVFNAKARTSLTIKQN